MHACVCVDFPITKLETPTPAAAVAAHTHHPEKTYQGCRDISKPPRGGGGRFALSVWVWVWIDGARGARAGVLGRGDNHARPSFLVFWVGIACYGNNKGTSPSRLSRFSSPTPPPHTPARKKPPWF